MNQPLKILGIPGSLRQGSYNRLALRAAQQLAPEGTTIEVFDRIGEMPLFNQDIDAHPPAVITDFKAAIQAADAVLFATPEYNYSIPGVLKNAIDWASRPYNKNAWDGKPAGIMSASGGPFGGGKAQYHLRQCMVFLNMHPVNRPEVLIGSAPQKFDAEGNLTDEAARNFIRQHLEALVALTRKMK